MTAEAAQHRGILWRAALFLLSLLVAVPLAFSPASAGAPVEITGDGDLLLRPHVRALFEQDKPLDPETVAGMSDQGVPHPVSPPSFGRFAKPVWGYVAVVNRLQRREWILSYSLSTVEDVRVYVRTQGEPLFHQLHQLGEDAIWPFTGYRSANYVLTLEPDVPLEIAVRVHTRTPVGFHLLLATTMSFLDTDRRQVAAAALLSAVPLVVLVYVAILAAVLRQRGLIGLMVMLVTKLMMDAWVSGFGLMVLPIVPRASWSTFGFVLVMVFSLASVAHIRRYLDLPQSAPRTDKLLLGFAATFLVLCVVELTHLANVRFISQSLAPLALIVFASAAVRFAFRERTFGSACYALAWILLFAQTIMQLGRLLTLIPFSVETVEFAQSAIASLLFGVAVFRRVKDRDQSLNRSLVESNERLGLVIDGSATAIFEYSFASGTLSCAPRLKQMLAVSDRTPLRGVLAKLSRPARRQLFGALRKALATRARYFRAEIAHAVAAGPPHFLAVTGAIQYGASGEPDRICGSAIDVTSERALAAEKELREILSTEKERAERSLRARTIFYAAANHDLRHPLLSLGLYLQMLAKNVTLKRTKDFLPRMLDAHRSAFGYLDRIVELARTDTVSEQLPRLQQPLQPILARLIERCQADASAAGLSLRCVATTSTVYTDAFLLDRILSNLLSNAIRNTQSGGVLLGCRRRNGGVRIDVVDTGPGLPDAVHQRIRSDGEHGPVNETAGPVHLGLVIVRRTVQELGYQLETETRPGKGTRFSVVVPDFSARQSLAG